MLLLIFRFERTQLLLFYVFCFVYIEKNILVFFFTFKWESIISLAVNVVTPVIYVIISIPFEVYTFLYIYFFLCLCRKEILSVFIFIFNCETYVCQLFRAVFYFLVIFINFQIILYKKVSSLPVWFTKKRILVFFLLTNDKLHSLSGGYFLICMIRVTRSQIYTSFCLFSVWSMQTRTIRVCFLKYKGETRLSCGKCCQFVLSALFILRNTGVCSSVWFIKKKYLPLFFSLVKEKLACVWRWVLLICVVIVSSS